MVRNFTKIEIFEAYMKTVILRSHISNVLLAKVCGPVLCLGISLLFLGDEFSSRRSMLATPFLIAAFFGASLAIVELRGEVLRYRRLFKWTIIPENEIVSARVECPPVIGSLRLKRFLFPWGRLYFVLDENLDPNPFHRGEYPLLLFIRKRHIHENQDAAKSNTQKNRAAKLVAAAMGGALSYILYQLFYAWRFSRFEPPQPVHPPGPVAIEVLFQISQLFTSFEVLYIVFVVFTLLAIYKYRQRDAWIYAFLAGMALPRILLHWL